MRIQSTEISRERRNFLITSGWLAAGVTVLTSCGGLVPVLPTTADPEPGDGALWLQMLADGRVRFLCPRMEMGQGASLGLSQIVAGELGLDQSRIECVTPRSDQVPPFKMTVGSDSLVMFSEPVARGAAGLREDLRRRAADKFELPIADIKDAAGGFAAANRVIDYAELIPAGADFVIAATENDAPTRFAIRAGSHQAVGKPWPHPALEDIVTGKTIFSRDVSLPGMALGDVVRPPRFGATLRDVVDNGARDVPGVLAVVIDKPNNFVGVVAEHRDALAAGLAKIEVRWRKPDDIPTADLLEVSKYRTTQDFEHTLIDQGRDEPAAAKTVNAAYSTSYMAHAAMEPRAAVARITQEKAEIWCGSQDPFFIRGRVAALIGRKKTEVVVHPLRMGGGFGGRVLCQPAEEAALLSARVGRPVRVQWDRETEFQQNYFQPKFSHAIDAALDAEGKVTLWRHDFVSAPIIFGLAPKSVAPLLDAFVADEGTARGAEPPYALPNRRVRYSDLRTDIPIGAWRGLGAAPNTFAIESMMDELAAAAGQDPLAFRLDHLAGPGGDARLAAVLRRVGDNAGWTTAASSRRDMGVAAAVYKGQTHVAVIARVHVDHQAREISVVKLWCVQDCGQVVNPDQVNNQISGNLVWGCGLALKEKLTITDGVADQQNFDSYEVLRHADAPRVHIELVENGARGPKGVGEAAFGPVAPAIANAVFAATGKRPRQLPFDYDSLYADKVNA